MVETAGRRVGLDANPHALRNTAITRALTVTGGDVRAVRLFSRHADSRTVAAHDDARQDLAGRVARQVVDVQAQSPPRRWTLRRAQGRADYHRPRRAVRMDWLRSIGALAEIVAAFTLVLVVAAIVVATARGPRRLSIVLLVASAMPFVCGSIGLVGGYFASMNKIESADAPTPKDLVAGVRDSALCFAVGAAGSFVSVAAAVVAFMRSPAVGESPPPR